MRQRNVLLRIDDYAGKPVMAYRDIPFKVVDQISNNEATIT